MQMLPKTLESTVKVRFPDCDPFNHLNNSKYIDYVINAREDQLLANYDLDIHKLAREQGISWVVAQNQVAYLTPATLMETVTIQTQLIYCDSKSLVVEALMWNEDKTSLKSVQWSKFIHVDLRTKKSHTHSDDLMHLFTEVVNPPLEQVSFENRVKGLRFSKVS